MIVGRYLPRVRESVAIQSKVHLLAVVFLTMPTIGILLF